MAGEAGIVGLLVAALGGTAIGLERQWSGHAEGPAARFAGIRTFTMLGVVAGVSGRLWSEGLTALAAILLAGTAAVIVAGYVAASRQDVDGTTEVAALVVLAAGVLAGTGAVRVASGIVAAACLLLVEKSRLHALVRRLGDSELRAAARFAVMALVVLPLLPEGPYGPFGGIRPRELWALVLFFSGLSFFGYVARRSAGASHGYLLTGLLGGLVSSTNVTFTFARLSRGDVELSRALAFGVVAANAVLYPRVLLAVAVLNPPLVQPLIPLLAGPALVATVAAASGAGRMPAAGPCQLAERNPLQLGAALQMTVLFQLVIVAVHLAGTIWGNAGVVTSAAVLGLTDVDALTMSMARGIAESGSLQLAAFAIAVGVLANTVFKLAVVVVFGEARFRAIAGGTLAVMVVTAAAVLLLRAPVGDADERAGRATAAEVLETSGEAAEPNR